MKIFYVVLLSLVFLIPLPSKALSLPTLPFGGYVLFTIPCTCTPGAFWIFYSPAFIGTTLPTPGALVYSPLTAVPYLNYLPGVPTTWELGNFIPGAGICAVGIPPACVPLPSAGLITQIGTSFPGAVPIN